MIIGLQLLALFLLLILSGFFSSSEIAYFSLDSLQIRRIQAEHPRAGERVGWILSRRTRLLSTILIGNTFVNVAIPALIFSTCATIFGEVGGVISIPVSLLLLLVFGEIGPKRFAVAFPGEMARLFSRPMTFSIWIFSPFRVLLNTATKRIEHLFHPRGRNLSDEEFESVVEISGEEGVLEFEEQAMLKGIIRMEDLSAGDVMTPRVDIIGFDLTEEDTTLLETAQQTRVRKILLYRDTIDQIEGLLDVRRFLIDPEHDIDKASFKPIFVPEACPLDKLLAVMLKNKRRTAVVVDEYGGTAGVVTRGDILEEIVGEVDDERGAHELLFQQISENRWMCDGRVNLESLSDQLNVEFEEEGVDRISGWITAQIERMPHPGDQVNLPPYTFTVRQMRKNSISLLEIIRAPMDKVNS